MALADDIIPRSFSARPEGYVRKNASAEGLPARAPACFEFDSDALERRPQRGYTLHVWLKKTAVYPDMAFSLV